MNSLSAPETPSRTTSTESNEDTAKAIWLPLTGRASAASTVWYADSANRWLVFPAAITLLFAFSDLILLPSSTVVVPAENFVRAARILGMLVLCYVIGRGMSRRYRDDHSAPGNFLRNSADGLAILAKAGAIFVPYGLFSALFMYLASATTAPLIDSRLAAIDAAMGFHWPDFLRLLNSSTVLSSVLVFAYQSTGGFIVLLFLFHSFALREERLLEFIALLAITSVFTGALMFLFPAAGAYSWFRPSPETFSNFTADAGMWHHAELMALRSGQPFEFIATQGTGLVTFPSFHTVLAIILAYSVRGIRFVAPAAVLLSAATILGTIPQGGHHLIDLIVGGAIALAGVLCVRTYARRHTE